MIEIIVLVFQVITLLVLLAMYNEVMDIADYLFFREVVMDDKGDL